MGWLVGEEIVYRLRVDFQVVHPHEPSDEGEQHDRLLNSAEAAIRWALDRTGLKGIYDLDFESSNITAWHEVAATAPHDDPGAPNWTKRCT